MKPNDASTASPDSETIDASSACGVHISVAFMAEIRVGGFRGYHFSVGVLSFVRVYLTEMATDYGRVAYIYLRLAKVPFDLDFNLLDPDSVCTLLGGPNYWDSRGHKLILETENASDGVQFGSDNVVEGVQSGVDNVVEGVQYGLHSLNNIMNSRLHSLNNIFRARLHFRNSSISFKLHSLNINISSRMHFHNNIPSSRLHSNNRSAVWS
ncbi:hypothetical protein QQ045_032575 [Rhodiola kirilowii]